MYVNLVVGVLLNLGISFDTSACTPGNAHTYAHLNAAKLFQHPTIYCVTRSEDSELFLHSSIPSQSVHTIGKMFPCFDPTCREAFDSEAQRKEHMLVVHDVQ